MYTAIYCNPSGNSIMTSCRLKEDLAEIKTATAARNAGRVRKYTILDPDYIPNAISI